MSNSLAVIETVLDQDHVVMVEIDHIGKIPVETEVPLQDAAVVVADVIVHIVPNGLFGLIIYHHAAGKVLSRNIIHLIKIYESYIMTSSKIIFWTFISSEEYSVCDVDVVVRRDWRFLSLMGLSWWVNFISFIGNVYDRKLTGSSGLYTGRSITWFGCGTFVGIY